MLVSTLGNRDELEIFVVEVRHRPIHRVVSPNEKAQPPSVSRANGTTNVNDESTMLQTATA